MKNLVKVMLGLAAATAVTASAAGNFPFPQNTKYPHGKIIEYADTDMIKSHYAKWKQAWYQASNGYVLAPEGTCSTVSEAIAYGMLITVYMDDQEVFKNLYKTWTSNSVGANGGMNWRIGCSGGTGTASDADFDAALALVMASKQWNDASYLTAGKSLITWIASNDIGSNKIKPGNQWNDGFNPSYTTTANFQLFQDVAGGSWSSVISQAYTDLNACQDSKTGLVPDWCDWNSHKPILTSAAVANDIGFYDDAARTPWRMAWAYYWYGDTKAQAFNKKIVDWLIPETRTASGVNSGYKYTGGIFMADKSDERNFVSSTFSGGLGLATSSIDSKEAETYLGTVYKVLKEKESCTTAQGCGEGSVAGEKYYPATLNMLYLLLVTGNMPNFYNMTGFTAFTPDPSKAPSIKEGDGEHLAFGDTTVGVSGLWNWGAYHDKLGIGTKMVPDSGDSPLYKLDDGSIIARASMEIGPEPEWTPEAAAAGTLKYPSAGIAVSFKKDDCKKDKSCGVDFSALGIKYIRVTAKSTGPIRMAILNTITDENEEKKVENAGAGSEPGVYVDNTEDYKEVTYDMTPSDYGFVGLGGKSEITILDWVSRNNAPEGAQILKAIKGLKWEVKDAKGGIGEISIKAVEFLDGSKQAIDPVKLTGVEIKPVSLYKVSMMPTFSVRANGMKLEINGAKAGSVFAVYNMQGKAIAGGMLMSSSLTVNVPATGSYIVRVGSEMNRVNVK
ncbi:MULTISPECIES: glycosyl hydrolase family 8 [unclassified Fibrobacter]|uniref:glycosyl hydrolase family 8 n=1 Tax=unclassified Fibrobacter TaxID=2634177 RepID=UPI000912875B|nr:MULTISPECIES: glycosyl hydrolase family 8 [unclassified Fibrobacter]SHM74532.1 Glycosyl hydrolases family 8 [Fibrobacter sp. UWB7]SMG31399.1 Glycosyl hydrolases family 8 [Fibrobacter sp. UWB13]